MQYLEERGIGFDVQVPRVPIAPAAILFALRLGDAFARPDAPMAYSACRQATDGPFPEGSVGAGTGATVGKLFGIAQATTSGRGAPPRGYHPGNPTLAVVATNARLTKVQVTKVCQMAQHGLVRAISPVHTTLDGDLVIGLATGEVQAEVNAAGLAAADAVAQAIVRAAKMATSLGGLPAWS